MTFKDAKSVLETIRAGDEVARIRGENRARINEQANGFPPLSEEQAKEQNLKVNANFMEQPNLHATAKRQFTRNFEGMEHYFKIAIPTAPAQYQAEWETFITGHINGVLKASREFFFLNQNRWTALVAHGIAPQVWWDSDNWLSKFVPIEDWRVATDSETSFCNLEWTAIRLATSEGELAEKVFRKGADPGWKKGPVKKLLHHYRKQNTVDAAFQNYNWFDNPEKMAELIKQNLGLYSSDAVPTIPLWHFFFRQREEGKVSKAWMQRVVPDWGAQVDGDAEQEFLYTSDTPFAQDLSRFMHVQFGDLSNTTPQKVWSVRSLGFLLMEPCFWSNITFCRTLQHLMENFNVWFRVASPADRARAQAINLYDKAIIGQGVSIVPQNERHQVNHQLLQFATAQIKQKISEASASYTQQADTGTQKEQTAYETAVKMSMVNAMMEGLLLCASVQEKFSYQEMCRRFCIKDSTNEDAKEFRKACERKRIPVQYLDSKLWIVTPELPIGSGNPAMAISEAQQLLAMRPMYDQSAQREILHEATAVIASPNKAARWVPLDEGAKATPANKVAESDFNTLMRGNVVNVLETVSIAEQVETLIGLLAGEVVMLGKTGAELRDVIGLQAVVQHVKGLIGRIQQNQADAEQAKGYAKNLAGLEREIKAIEQQVAEKMQAQNGQPDPAELAKAEMTKMQAELKAAIAAAKFEADEMRKQVKAMSEQRRKDAELEASQRREDVKLASEIKREQVTTASDIGNQRAKTKADIANQKAKAQAEPAAEKD